MGRVVTFGLLLRHFNTMKNISLSEAKILSNAFSNSVMQDIALNRKPIKINEIVNKLTFFNITNDQTYLELFELFYKILIKNYRNEYVYKNALVSKLVVGRHRLHNISCFSEFPVWDVIADVVVVNGTTTVYEIKTQYDSLSRLPNQLATYQNVFDRIYTVIPEPKLPSLLPILPSNIGILILTDRYTLSEYREACSNINKLSPRKIFSCLRKYEYENIIIKYFGELPRVKAAFIRRESIPLFEQLSPKIVHLEFAKCLLERQFDDTRKRLIRGLPKPLLSLGITTKLSTAQLNQLVTNLRSPVII